MVVLFATKSFFMKRKRYSRIVASVISLASTGVFASSIIPIEDYNQSIRTFSGSTEIGILEKRRLTQKALCTIEQDGEGFVISPSCLLRPIIAEMSVKSALDLLTPYLEGVPIVYNTASPNFSYEATTPIFSQKLFPVTIRDPLDYAFLLSLQKEEKVFRVSKVQLAYLMSKSWSWYGVWKDMAPLKPCTKQNYYVAFSSLQDYVRASGTQLNLNDMIANRAGYCKGTGPKNLMFYGGVCGFATQLFRLSLLIPNVDTVERYEHSQRYVAYYSEYIFGDDAALYQNNKKLILQNNIGTDIYLKTLDFRNSTYLIAIVPKKISSYVEIKKEQVGNLKGQVTKVVKTLKSSRVAQEFLSYYTQRTYTVR
ncbi:hypothetical protein P148_SR1C00001G1094 [candidate division SR1 bacterium RAAC1_SR1_1]|nr:hypothetical protein P148_SR1C00001G1094 [candidate division SR1 bacterium RAAC1_SR1_1]